MNHSASNAADRVLNAAWTRWQMPTMSLADDNTSSAMCSAHRDTPNAEEFEDARQQARREGWEQGLQEGRIAAQGEQRLLATRWQSLMQELSQPLDHLDNEVQVQLMELTISLAKQLAKREISQQPEIILDVLREALGALPAGQHRIQVHLHPEDARLVREQMPNDGEHTWKLVENTAITRGGTQIISDSIRIDERFETRLERLVSQLMAGYDGAHHHEQASAA